ncbi:helix-turn-helix domain-containing protein [Aestuariicoccus sp. MJ-SS9]|uniref:helix-turn-helix domain-containing protein n=1 Tax=Aestuariicoccus sp. MJ-SS9 TaxID=3079855 RepID=UPI002912A2CB|nr:helix-turn-helix domain-containing protein [Aestuariicoccus sp. MJ-SS9]MDU8911762.1 helix-turn-helix domain-containing protein [Aestuariicoccus sp. MJ-SS9]
MSTPSAIPVFTLFGETGHFPDVVHCERISDRARSHDWAIAAHRHAQIAQLFCIEDGRMEAKVDGREWCLQSTEFLYIPAQSVHQFRFAPDTSGQVISFPLALVNGIGPDVAQALARPFAGRTAPGLSALVALLSATFAGNGTFRTQAAIALAHAVLASLAQEAAAADPGPGPQASTRLAQLDALIARHLGDGWGAADYARALSVSTGHLSRLCRAATGVGAAAYIEQSLMEEASRLLAFTQLSVAEVGYRLGFNDPSYFSKRFRRVRGETPTAYRQKFVS